MARKGVRAVELEEAILDACGVIDNCNQSRVELSEGMDNVRDILATAYGDEFDEDLAETMGIDLEDADLDEDDEDEDEDEDDEDGK